MENGEGPETYDKGVYIDQERRCIMINKEIPTISVITKESPLKCSGHRPLQYKESCDKNQASGREHKINQESER
jgi:hypothetical protein